MSAYLFYLPNYCETDISRLKLLRLCKLLTAKDEATCPAFTEPCLLGISEFCHWLQWELEQVQAISSAKRSSLWIILSWRFPLCCSLCRSHAAFIPSLAESANLWEAGQTPSHTKAFHLLAANSHYFYLHLVLLPGIQLSYGLFRWFFYCLKVITVRPQEGEKNTWTKL